MKKVIIIGSSSGKGKGLAECFAANNCKVGITGRRDELLIELKVKNQDAYLTKVLDVTDSTSSIQQLEELTNARGGLDLLVISSGIGEINEALDCYDFKAYSTTYL